jgi:uncharacterized alpha-E superfamily protein
MISRVAGNCFWMHRYVERVENTARMLQVNGAFVLDVQLPDVQRWRPFLIVAGEEPRFNELFGAKKAQDGEVVQEYLTWDERCSSSILTSLRWARENARTIRETISLEMWESLNEAWLWMKEGSARKLYLRDRHTFYNRVKDICLLFNGICHNTILNAEPFDFMRLGMLLERAGQTARILDVKYHTFGREQAADETAGEVAQWLALLRSCAAFDPFLKLSRPLSGPSVAGFLILEDAFPRSVMHCLTRAGEFLERIDQGSHLSGERRALAKLNALIGYVKPLTIGKFLERGLHAELTRIIDATADVCGAVHADFFDPVFEGLGRGQTQTQTQSQTQTQGENAA